MYCEGTGKECRIASQTLSLAAASIAASSSAARVHDDNDDDGDVYYNEDRDHDQDYGDEDYDYCHGNGDETHVDDRDVGARETTGYSHCYGYGHGDGDRSLCRDHDDDNGGAWDTHDDGSRRENRRGWVDEEVPDHDNHASARRSHPIDSLATMDRGTHRQSTSDVLERSDTYRDDGPFLSEDVDGAGIDRGSSHTVGVAEGRARAYSSKSARSARSSKWAMFIDTPDSDPFHDDEYDGARDVLTDSVSDAARCGTGVVITTLKPFRSKHDVGVGDGRRKHRLECTDYGGDRDRDDDDYDDDDDDVPLGDYTNSHTLTHGTDHPYVRVHSASTTSLAVFGVSPSTTSVGAGKRLRPNLYNDARATTAYIHEPVSEVTSSGTWYGGGATAGTHDRDSWRAD